MSDTEQVEAKPTVASIVAQLNRFGEHGIHQLLLEKGIKGRRRITLDCPIARYVYAETGAMVQVGGYWLNEFTAVTSYRHSLSDSVADFIASFDGGKYPDLLA